MDFSSSKSSDAGAGIRTVRLCVCPGELTVTVEWAFLTSGLLHSSFSRQPQAGGALTYWPTGVLSRDPVNILSKPHVSVGLSVSQRMQKLRCYIFKCRKLSAHTYTLIWCVTLQMPRMTQPPSLGREGNSSGSRQKGRLGKDLDRAVSSGGSCCPHWRFSLLATHRNHLRNFVKYQCLRFRFLWNGVWAGNQNSLKSALGDFIVQPKLGTIVLGAYCPVWWPRATCDY